MDWMKRIDRASVSAQGEAPAATTGSTRELQLSELVLPHLANHYGTLFGPNALALLGKAAFLMAARYTQQNVVMAGASQIDFLKPVPVGALLNLKARVVHTGRSSMSVQVVARLDAAPGTQAEAVLRGGFELVTVDELGRPCSLDLPHRAEAQELELPA